MITSAEQLKKTLQCGQYCLHRPGRLRECSDGYKVRIKARHLGLQRHVVRGLQCGDHAARDVVYLLREAYSMYLYG
jgi:hypothetical protein